MSYTKIMDDLIKIEKSKKNIQCFKYPSGLIILYRTGKVLISLKIHLNIVNSTHANILRGTLILMFPIFIDFLSFQNLKFFYIQIGPLSI